MHRRKRDLWLFVSELLVKLDEKQASYFCKNNQETTNPWSLCGLEWNDFGVVTKCQQENVPVGSKLRMFKTYSENASERWATLNMHKQQFVPPWTNSLTREEEREMDRYLQHGKKREEILLRRKKCAVTTTVRSKRQKTRENSFKYTFLNHLICYQNSWFDFTEGCHLMDDVFYLSE